MIILILNVFTKNSVEFIIIILNHNNIRELFIIQHKIKYIYWNFNALFTRHLVKIMCIIYNKTNI